MGRWSGAAWQPPGIFTGSGHPIKTMVPNKAFGHPNQRVGTGTHPSQGVGSGHTQAYAGRSSAPCFPNLTALGR